MLHTVLYAPRRDGPPARFYRVEVTDNLFGEYSVLREWGAAGRGGRRAVQWCANLREACVTADGWVRRARRRGFRHP
ncbi:WGR domain-containing protein [Plastorhodobacter daqingensis]|uniref:WGR domain-containing protein n=1 Tax=Plastorhodobacter daqingensis TaxID=1387281 RepID=A0ABW2ULX8_9RHOB